MTLPVPESRAVGGQPDPGKRSGVRPGPYVPSEAARKASDYFNALPIEERAKLAPLLENYRQMGLAEALEETQRATQRLTRRIDGIRRAEPPL